MIVVVRRAHSFKNDPVASTARFVVVGSLTVKDVKPYCPISVFAYVDMYV